MQWVQPYRVCQVGHRWVCLRIGRVREQRSVRRGSCTSMKQRTNYKNKYMLMLVTRERDLHSPTPTPPPGTRGRRSARNPPATYWKHRPCRLSIKVSYLRAHSRKVVPAAQLAYHVTSLPCYFVPRETPCDLRRSIHQPEVHVVRKGLRSSNGGVLTSLRNIIFA